MTSISWDGPHFVKIHAFFPVKLKHFKMPYRSVSNSTKSYWDLLWAETHPAPKFGGNVSSSFCVILLTNQLTKKTDRDEKHRHPLLR